MMILSFDCQAVGRVMIQWWCNDYKDIDWTFVTLIPELGNAVGQSVRQYLDSLHMIVLSGICRFYLMAGCLKIRNGSINVPLLNWIDCKQKPITILMQWVYDGWFIYTIYKSIALNAFLFCSCFAYFWTVSSLLCPEAFIILVIGTLALNDSVMNVLRHVWEVIQSRFNFM